MTGTPEDVVAGLARYRDAGARHVVVRPGALDLADQRDQLRRLAALLPELARQSCLEDRAARVRFPASP